MFVVLLYVHLFLNSEKLNYDYKSEIGDNALLVF